ncbi:phosphomannomutase [Quadrisphaera granulorum]|uniref:Phosphomannomutase n=1 Tax=Quadrisphaera granulorum TaxID=317664 RepID=A0A316A5G1_9ACTN|nr:phospho-sugar mutase [Quadrisphaera granulorum]PWJ52769.1 phosphomannomutase [Quadrisphaera granulorum]SZE97374.1 phosphomannomutase [Quadrisphaera granulorum]
MSATSSGVRLDARTAARARAWAEGDVDDDDRAALLALLARAEGIANDSAGAREAAAEVISALDGDLEFGTAGLRGALGPGSHRMNRAVVVRAAAGLASYLRRHAAPPDPEAGAPLCVIGYDARHGSAQFARDTAAVMTAAGVRALLLPRPLPTPVLAFAVRHLDADAGVMVTASHNPPQDNGYKVYLGGRCAPATGSRAETRADAPGRGAQIVPPADAQIAAEIAAQPPAREVPRAERGWSVLGGDLLDAYLRAVSALPGPPPADGRRSQLRVVLTPVHGVGGAVVMEALRRAGVTDVAIVPEQADPDPDFPTTTFPNPEEPGVLDLALALARRRDAHLVVAVDPDADRCAVAVPDPSRHGGWRALTGDELGAVLGEHAASGGLAGPRRVLPPGATLACSLVSSSLLGRIAAAHGVGHAETLTGFKWISRAPGLVFGYEEAIGYCVAPDLVRDKDGVSAAVVVAALAADLAPRGSTLLSVLDELAVAHGVHATGQVSVRVEDLSLISDAMARLRAEPPAELAGAVVERVDDLSVGSVATTGVPATDGLRWTLAGGGRVVVRPSGTEPKLKCYLEVVEPVEGRGALDGARQRAAVRLAALAEEVRGLLAL